MTASRPPRTLREGLAMQQKRVSERQVQRQIVDYLRLLGATVYVLGTVRRKGDHPGTMQTPGIPDLYVFLPAKAYASTDLWIEVKAEGGKCSPAQLAFQKHAKERAINYVCGDFNAVATWLNGYGFELR